MPGSPLKNTFLKHLSNFANTFCCLFSLTSGSFLMVLSRNLSLLSVVCVVLHVSDVVLCPGHHFYLHHCYLWWCNSSANVNNSSSVKFPATVQFLVGMSMSIYSVRSLSFGEQIIHARDIFLDPGLHFCLHCLFYAVAERIMRRNDLRVIPHVRQKLFLCTWKQAHNSENFLNGVFTISLTDIKCNF